MDASLYFPLWKYLLPLAMHLSRIARGSRLQAIDKMQAAATINHARFMSAGSNPSAPLSVYQLYTSVAHALSRAVFTTCENLTTRRRPNLGRPLPPLLGFFSMTHPLFYIGEGFKRPRQW